MATIISYLTFNGKCREAMTFYRDCLGGELTFQEIGTSPMAEQFTGDNDKKILHSSLTNGSLVLMASDMGGGDPLVKGNTVTMCIDCTTEEELNTYFTKLSSGGQITHPLFDFYAGRMGVLTDRYEKDWMLFYNNVGKGNTVAQD